MSSLMLNYQRGGLSLSLYSASTTADEEMERLRTLCDIDDVNLVKWHDDG